MAVCVSSFHTHFLNRSISNFDVSRTPVAVLSSGKKMRVSYDLKEGQSRIFHELSSGLSIEVIVQKGVAAGVEHSSTPPLVFVHGSYHAAWCWAEHWFPFFFCFWLRLLCP